MEFWKFFFLCICSEALDSDTFFPRVHMYISDNFLNNFFFRLYRKAFKKLIKIFRYLVELCCCTLIFFVHKIIKIFLNIMGFNFKLTKYLIFYTSFFEYFFQTCHVHVQTQQLFPLHSAILPTIFGK